MPPIKVPERKVSLKEASRIIKRLWQYLYRFKWMLLLALLLTLSANLLMLVGPMLSGRAINAIEPGQGRVDFESVFFYAGLMIAFYLVSAGLSLLLARLMIRLSQKVVYRMRKDVYDRLLDLPVGYFDSKQTGDLVSRISYDIDTVNASLSNDLLQACASVITVVGSLAMMLTLSPVLVLVFAVTVPVSVLFTKFLATKVHPLFRRRSAKLGELNGFSEEMISGLRTIRAYHKEDTMMGRFDSKNTEAVDAYYAADYYGSMTGPSVNFINNVSLALISVFGSLLFLRGSITLGNLSSFVLYSRKFSGPINEMANIISELQSACAAAERVFKLIDEPPEPADAPDAQPVDTVEGEVTLEHVHFGYDPNIAVLHDLSLCAQPGSLTAIVGPTGAGKTTLINLLMRFYDPQSGRLLLDGQDISGLTRAGLRSAYTMVLQDTWLFHGTIYDNIAYGRQGATRDEVIAAAKAAKIHGYISRLPDGYDTLLSEEGMNISKGQKQMLTIARAMLLESGMLILDEATSNVDTRTEQQIQEAMRELIRGKTCFVIAHRLSTIQNADHILVMRDGDVIEQGTHNDLLALGGFYAELYYSQFN